MNTMTNDAISASTAAPSASTSTGSDFTSAAAIPATAVVPPASTPTPLLKNKIAISFLNVDTDVQLVNDSSKISGMMTGNAFYPTPLPTLAQIGTAQVAFAAAVNALNRSKASTVARDQARQALVQLLRELALYVQQASGGDPAKLLSSGFPMQRKRGVALAEPQPPKSLRVRQSAVSGCLLARCDADASAKSYQWRIATVLAPTVWTTNDPVTVARFTFVSLVPGTQYLVQVRAFARSGASNWSNSVAMFSN